ncbi:hypothetical protein OAG73_01170, partial [bacterium]|nr:hypothetical protein [bacterium]
MSFPPPKNGDDIFYENSPKVKTQSNLKANPCTLFTVFVCHFFRTTFGLQNQGFGGVSGFLLVIELSKLVQC